jgi:hypothetical protein
MATAGRSRLLRRRVEKLGGGRRGDDGAGGVAGTGVAVAVLVGVALLCPLLLEE